MVTAVMQSKSSAIISSLLYHSGDIIRIMKILVSLLVIITTTITTVKSIGTIDSNSNNNNEVFIMDDDKNIKIKYC